LLACLAAFALEALAIITTDRHFTDAFVPMKRRAAATHRTVWCPFSSRSAAPVRFLPMSDPNSVVLVPDYSLRPYHTFGFDARTRWFCHIESPEQFAAVWHDPRVRGWPHSTSASRTS